MNLALTITKWVFLIIPFIIRLVPLLPKLRKEIPEAIAAAVAFGSGMLGKLIDGKLTPEEQKQSATELQKFLSELEHVLVLFRKVKGG